MSKRPKRPAGKKRRSSVTSPFHFGWYAARCFWRFYVYRDKAKEWRWNLRHANGHIVAESGEGYKRKSSCLLTVKHLRSRLADAPIRVQDARTDRYLVSR